MASREDEFLKAIADALAGNWQTAHAVAQRHEGAPLADWLHATLHKIEGDAENARYWYRRAGRSITAFTDTTSELHAIEDELKSSFR
jgi:hypothetical protein